MLELTARKIAQYLVKCKEVSSYDAEFECYKYGIEVILSSLLNAAVVLIIGFATNYLIESIVFLITFVFVRQFTGGYHADTYFKCNLYLCVLFALLLALYDGLKEYNSLYLILLIDFVSLLVVSFFSPIENRNKFIEKKRKFGLKLKSILISLIISVISIIMYCYSIKYDILLSCTLLLISILIIAGKIKERPTIKSQ